MFFQYVTSSCKRLCLVTNEKSYIICIQASQYKCNHFQIPKHANLTIRLTTCMTLKLFSVLNKIPNHNNNYTKHYTKNNI